MGKHYSLAIYNYNRQKICDLYDSEVELMGQAFDIEVSVEMNGYHTLSFNIPYIIDLANVEATVGPSSLFGEAIFGQSVFGGTGGGSTTSVSNKNFRWDFMKSDYLIRYTCGTEKIWFVADKPTKSKSGKKIIGTVTCSGFESLLKTRNIYMEFDDTNGIGTIQYILDQVLMGTGWSFDAEHSDILYETDGETEKIRSLKNTSKSGSLGLITTTCNLFQARPIFDTENMKVIIKAMNNRRQVLEGEVGRNLQSLSVKQDSSGIATRVYVEGEYGDHGYVGIDNVEVDGEPWGVPFIINFDYYRSIGLFTQEHEQALATYMEDIRDIKSQIRTAGAEMIACEDTLNNLVGQCRFVVYYKDVSLETPSHVYGYVTTEQAALHIDDEVVILKDNGTHIYTQWTGNAVLQLTGAYGVAKFITKSAGRIGAAEVQIEAKEKEITRLQNKIASLPSTSAKRPEYLAEIARLEAEIEAVYEGSEDVEGLYELMQQVMEENGLLYDYDEIKGVVDGLNAEQDEIEATFIAAMGYLLRDGYWSNQNYIPGQEQFLYDDAITMAKEMSRPKTEYNFSYTRIIEEFDVQPEDIEINAIFKLYDRELQVDDKMFIKKIVYGVDNKELGSIEVSNQDITLTGNDLGSLLSRMSQLADLIEQKNALYDRAKAISENGSIYADRLNGQIDVMKTKILSSVSNWHTDDSGNILFESVDGSGAMMLSGAGFMLASGKDEDGNWNWRSYGDGHGFTADEIVAGFLSADRIEAGSIEASKLSAAVGEELDLSSNVALNAYITSEAENAAAEMALTPEQFYVMLTDPNGMSSGYVNSVAGEVRSELQQYQSEVSAYMRFDSNGTLTLGKSNSPMTTQITNNRMSFMDGATEVAYISNQNMYITNARVTEALSIGTDNGFGYFDWTVTSLGLGLKWRG